MLRGFCIERSLEWEVLGLSMGFSIGLGLCMGFSIGLMDAK